ncbi:hypothetical protein TanjilG_28585 [Lupinus angustifolius]|uniref:Condensation domain-containing protein n=1 Tax=Lupinus angustifolius TaxID=3871 RepID=A0A4P1RIW0_LUPAN|nr:PREDICTED: uncharacterized protein LOC109347538 [Lupinus angustifolius]XP_019442992.1 PREDICTED: uncharacterized protein LOC109347538 [Lupinus angustifolius]OIW12177.1 hypothetical protein TanjilG_28585 [Lupinus angustifolius]
MPDSTTRPVGGTEFSWCKAVPGGTGVTVLGLLLSKPPPISIIQNTLHNLQNSHPILRSKIHLDASTNTFHFVTPSNPRIQIEPFDLQSTAQIIDTESNGHDHGDNHTHNHTNPFQILVEHEMNRNAWRDIGNADSDVIYASAYEISNERFAVFIRIHTAACDRAAAVALLREMMRRVSGGGDGGRGEKEEEMNLAIEEMIPMEKRNKPFWARGLDMLGYSLNALRLGNLGFVDTESQRSSKVVRMQLNAQETMSLISGCKSRGIKLCAALAAAGMIASWTSKHLPEYQKEKYAVVTLIDCRSTLDPVLPNNHLGFYHSAIMNTHDVCEEPLWELAERCYTSFINSMNYNKHYSDMADLNYLMCKAIENPGLTPSSSLRTALISVFEDTVIDDSEQNEMHKELGLEDIVGCASAHGIGPSLAVFDTIRDGKLDCAFVYPSPLHSREQIQELVDHMKRILVDGCNSENQN